MATSSNVYTEKIFSEHPTLTWSFDESIGYLSLISEEQRDLTSWTPSIEEVVIEKDESVIGEPFKNSFTYRVNGIQLSENQLTTKVLIKSPDFFNFNDLDLDLKTFSIGAWLYSEGEYISSTFLGYTYIDSANGETVSVIKEFETPFVKKWFFVSESFEIPHETSDVSLVIGYRFSNGSTNPNDYDLLINGLSFGQWSEEYNSTSLGIIAENFPDDINLSCNEGYEISSYGINNQKAYCLISDNRLLARTNSVPLVFGSANSLTLYPHNTLPSIIFPGLGMFNESNKYSSYTFEFWARIVSDTNVDKKICGPINSSDGLYVNGPFLKLKINSFIISHFVGEWGRPMLIHIRLSKNTASLLVNGQNVGSVNFNSEDIIFSNPTTDGKSNDWIGFWSYEDVSPIEIDGVAIYSYGVAEILAKRRFVYGQAVDIPDNINTAFGGTTALIDYEFADYSKNYSYPDLGKWDQGARENVIIEDNKISTPKYNYPELYLTNKTVSEFYIDNINLQQEDEELFWTFKKTNDEVNEGFLSFESLDFMTEPIRCFYGVFKSRRAVSTPETIFYIQSDVSDERFIIEIVDDVIQYKFITPKRLDPNTGLPVEQILYVSSGHTINDEFTIGLDIETFTNYYGGDLVSFFNDKKSLKFYVGGSKNLENTYHGNMYKIGFCSDRNYNEIVDFFNTRGLPIDYENVFDWFIQTELVDTDGGSNPYAVGGYYNANGDFVEVNDSWWEFYLDGGLATSFVASRLLNHVASYMLHARYSFGSYILDIATKSYWKDYIPLSYFAERVLDAKGDEYYDLDLLQFNINYPAPTKFIKEETEGSWTYKELKEKYSNPIQRSYDSLDNHLFTGYNDYSDLAKNAQFSYRYNTDDSYLKSYINFEYIRNGMTLQDSYFENIEPASQSGVVDPQDNWVTTKYEVVYNMIIYPPKDIDPRKLGIKISLEFINYGTMNGIVSLKSMQLASQAFNSYRANAIGTRGEAKLYPYVKNGFYYNYKARNPFSIYKSSSPYLYLTQKSGIEPKDIYDPVLNRGLQIPINSNKDSNYQLMSFQSAVMYNKDSFPYSPTQVFEIKSDDSHIKFYTKAIQSDGKRGIIYAINAKTRKIDNNVVFYLNGRLVKNPILNTKQWAFIGVSFSNLFDCSGNIGSLNLNGPLIYNVISYYQATNLQEVQDVTLRPWVLVRGIRTSELHWSFWNSPVISWNGVLVLSSTSYYGANPSNIYNSYTGRDKIIAESDMIFSIKDYEYSVYSNASWVSNTSTAI